MKKLKKKFHENTDSTQNGDSLESQCGRPDGNFAKKLFSPDESMRTHC